MSTLTLAFGTDPVARWCWPDPDSYLQSFPSFCQAFGGGALHSESGFEIADFGGAALWLPPGAEPDEAALIALIESSVSSSLKPALYALLQSMGEHHPTEPHWYLPLIGVDPLLQGHGLGRLLMEPMLARCDAEHMPAYLESTNPRNVPFYERLGFRSIGRLQVADCPAIQPMLRAAR